MSSPIFCHFVGVKTCTILSRPIETEESVGILAESQTSLYYRTAEQTFGQAYEIILLSV